MISLLKAVFVLTLTLLTAVANASDVVTRFQSFISISVEKTNRTKKAYLNKHTSKWSARVFEITDLKLDVKKTDSLVNPIVGLVSYVLTTKQTEFMDSEAEAQQSASFSERHSNKYEIQLTYFIQNDKWILGEGRYVSAVLPKDKFSFVKSSIEKEPTAVPFAALLHWVSE